MGATVPQLPSAHETRSDGRERLERTIIPNNETMRWVKIGLSFIRIIVSIISIRFNVILDHEIMHSRCHGNMMIVLSLANIERNFTV